MPLGTMACPGFISVPYLCGKIMPSGNACRWGEDALIHRLKMKRRINPRYHAFLPPAEQEAGK